MLKSRERAMSPATMIADIQDKMKYESLGNTGLLVSRLCLGAMTFGDGQGPFKAIGAVGQKEAAIAEGKRATELLPESEDAYDGPEITCRLAQIYALTGESDKAFRLLDHLLEVPTVSRSPCSNSIRHGSRCGKIRVFKH